MPPVRTGRSRPDRWHARAALRFERVGRGRATGPGGPPQPAPVPSACRHPAFAPAIPVGPVAACNRSFPGRSPGFACPGHGPDRPRPAVGQGDGHEPGRPFRRHPSRPVVSRIAALAGGDHPRGAGVEQAADVSVPRPGDRPRPLPAPLACGFGARPGQAGRTRAGRKAGTSGNVAAGTPAVIGPMPGMVCRRRAVSPAAAARRRPVAMASMRVFVSVTCPTGRSGGIRAASGRPAPPRLRQPDGSCSMRPGRDDAERPEMGAERTGAPGQPADRNVPRPMPQRHRLRQRGPDRHAAQPRP